MDQIFRTNNFSSVESLLRRMGNIYEACSFWLAVGVAITAISLQLFRTWWCLRHISGPPLASITNLQRVWWVRTGRAHLHHQAIHAKYGDVVRIGPHMVSISNPEAIPTIYPIKPGFPKVCVYSHPTKRRFQTDLQFLFRAISMPHCVLTRENTALRWPYSIRRTNRCTSGSRAPLHRSSHSLTL